MMSGFNTPQVVRLSFQEVADQYSDLLIQRSAGFTSRTPKTRCGFYWWSEAKSCPHLDLA
jgi:hypothetical protein